VPAGRADQDAVALADVGVVLLERTGSYDRSSAASQESDDTKACRADLDDDVAQLMQVIAFAPLV
jgi:hypothetical protein